MKGSPSTAQQLVLVSSLRGTEMVQPLCLPLAVQLTLSPVPHLLTMVCISATGTLSNLARLLLIHGVLSSLVSNGIEMLSGYLYAGPWII